MGLIDFSTAALPHAGDILPDGGIGLSSSSVTNQTDLEVYGEDEYDGDDGGDIVRGTEPLVGTPADHPIGGWLTLGVILMVLLYFRAKGVGDGGTKVHLGIGETGIIALSTLVWFVLAKWVLGIYKIPGLSQVVEYV
jgi:hypothetical protein